MVAIRVLAWRSRFCCWRRMAMIAQAGAIDRMRFGGIGVRLPLLNGIWTRARHDGVAHRGHRIGPLSGKPRAPQSAFRCVVGWLQGGGRQGSSVPPGSRPGGPCPPPARWSRSERGAGYGAGRAGLVSGGRGRLGGGCGRVSPGGAAGGRLVAGRDTFRDVHFVRVRGADAGVVRAGEWFVAGRGSGLHVAGGPVVSGRGF
jgi:hypothetical protein